MKLPLAGICIGILFFAMIIPYTLRTVDRFRLIRVQGEETAEVSFGGGYSSYTFKITEWENGIVSQFEVCWGNEDSDLVIDQSNFTDVGVGKRYFFNLVEMEVIVVGSDHMVLLAENPIPRY